MLKGTVRVSTQAHKFLLGLALAFSFLLKMAYVYANPVVNRDAAVYIAAAQKFSAGEYAEMLQHYPMPVYPVLLALVHALIPDWILAGRLLSAIPLLLCIFPLYLLSARLFGRSSAVAAAMLFAVLPVFNEAATEIIRDPLFLLATLGSLALLAEYCCRKSTILFAAAMTCAVLSSLLRIEGVIMLVLLPALYLWHVRDQLNRRSLWRMVFVMLMPFALLGIVLGSFAQLGMESWSRVPEVLAWIHGVFTLNIFDTYQELQELLRGFEQQTPGANLRNNLIETARHYVPLLYVIGLVEILVKEVFPLSLLALWAVYKNRRCSNEQIAAPGNRVSTAIVLWPWIIFVLLNLLFCLVYNFTTTRYMWVPIVMTLPATGYGIELWRQGMAARSPIFIALIAVFFLAPAFKSIADIPVRNPTVSQAGAWLQSYDPQGQKKALFNDRSISIYANRIYAPTQDNAFDFISRNQNWMPQVDIFVLSLNKDDIDCLPLPGFKEQARFTSGPEQIIFLERDR